MNKKGELAWEYIAAIVIALIVLVIIIIFSTSLRDKIIDAITGFGRSGLGR